jgi:hypothetical protein
VSGDRGEFLTFEAQQPRACIHPAYRCILVLSVKSRPHRDVLDRPAGRWKRRDGMGWTAAYSYVSYSRVVPFSRDSGCMTPAGITINISLTRGVGSCFEATHDG